MEVFINGAAATIGGIPIGVLSPAVDLSTTIDNTNRVQGRDLAGSGGLHIDDVSWTLFEPVTWTETFDYNTGAVAGVAGAWTLVAGNLDSFVITNGVAGSPSGNNMLDLPDSGTQTRVDRDMGPVIEGLKYRARAYIFAENPGPSADVASLALISTGGTQVVGWGLDDGEVTLFVPLTSNAVYKTDGLSINTWQLYEVIYCPIAGAPDQIEVFIDGVSAETNGAPIGVLSPAVDLSTNAFNTFRIQGRDVSGFSALHIDDVTWEDIPPPPPPGGIVLTIH
jgi:hypothetical protein